MPIADFVNDNAGWWALVALPLMVLGTVLGAKQALPALRTARRDEAENLELLRKQIRRRRIASELSQRLVLGELLESRLRATGKDDPVGVAGLYEAIENGSQALVTGPGGTGKTVLGLALVEHSIEQSAADSKRPLLEVISLQEWRWDAAVEWEDLVKWAAARLARAYPLFSAGHFRQLLKSQQLTVCLDGLDELAKEMRAALLSSLRAYMDAGFPIVVLSRDSDPLSVTTEGYVETPAPRFDRFELLPLDEAALRQLPDWAVWEQFVSNARQPHRAAALLRNPLRLGIAALTWHRSERPDALRDSEDPDETLWTTFFDRHLGPRSGDSGALRSRAGWIALLAPQWDATSFRAGDLYASARAAVPTLLLCALPALAIGWMVGALGVSAMLIAGLSLALIPNENQPWIERVALRAVPRRGDSLQMAAFIVVLSAFLVSAFALGAAVEALLVAAGLPDQGGASSAWDYVGVAILCTTPVFGLALLNLRSRGFFRLPDTAPSFTVPLVGAILLAVGLAQEDLVLTLAALPLLAPWVFAAASRLSLVSAGALPASGLDRVCDQLARLGILYKTDGNYRFRHDEIARQLGRETLAEPRRIGELSAPTRAWPLFDTGLDAGALSRTDRLTTELVRSLRYDRVAVSVRASYLYLGALEPEAGWPVVSDFVALFPRGTTRVHLAEILDARGAHEEADPLWQGLIDEHPSYLWIVNKWIRRGVLHGDHRKVLRFLRDQPRIDRNEPYLRLLRATLQCRLGSDSERREGLVALVDLRADPFAAGRATIELARVMSEVWGDLDEAEQLLTPWLRESGALSSLLCARIALLRSAAGDTRAAEQVLREAVGLLRWNLEPIEQLEILATAAAISPQPDLVARLEALVGFGLRLVGRDPGPLAAAGLDGPLLSRLFARQARLQPPVTTTRRPG